MERSNALTSIPANAPARPAVRVIVFDLDDTLYLEREFALSGFDAVARAFAEVLGDARGARADMERLFDSPARPRVFNALLEMRGLAVEPALVARMVEVYRTHEPRISLLPDAARAFASWASRCRLALLTDGPTVTQRAKIAALGLTGGLIGRLDPIIVTSELGEGFGKPHIRAFERVEQMTGRLAAEHAYVADNVAKDFIAPNQLGWRSVRVRRREGIYRDEPAAEGGLPHATIESLDNLEQALT